MAEILLGSHVGMSGKEMFLGSVKEAESYGANVLMVYTGAPQNTRRKEIGEARRWELSPPPGPVGGFRKNTKNWRRCSHQKKAAELIRCEQFPPHL